MAPPRQHRPPTTVPGGTLDDSRSEGSSTTTGNTTSRGVPGPKPRKAAATTGSVSTTSAPLASSKDLKVAAATGAAAAAAAAAAVAAGTMEYGENLGDLPGIPWHQMPRSILHDYRHAYKLSTPSAYARPISKLYFATGIGLRSPTAIAARKAASFTAAPTSSSGSSVSMSTGSSAAAIQRSRAMNSRQVTSRSDSVLGRTRPKIHSQDRVSKEQLALAVRKHFNAAGLVEQDAIARFLYKVREEGKGREFRLRFQP